jgi:hypothetical protein
MLKECRREEAADVNVVYGLIDFVSLGLVSKISRLAGVLVSLRLSCYAHPDIYIVVLRKILGESTMHM